MADPQPAETAVELLLDHLLRGSRGRVVVEDGDAVVSALVHAGRLVGCESSDDAFRLLQRACREGWVPLERLAPLVEAVGQDQTLAPLLDLIPPDGLDRVLRERFVDNLARLASCEAPALFDETGATFATNVQIIQDPAGLIDTCRDIGERARALQPDVVVVPGPRAPADEPQRRVVAIVANGPAAVGALAHQLPMEPLTACALLSLMLENRVVVRPEEAASVNGEALAPIPSRAVEVPSMPFADLLGTHEPPATRRISLPADAVRRITSDDATITPEPPPPRQPPPPAAAPLVDVPPAGRAPIAFAVGLVALVVAVLVAAWAAA